LANVNLFSSFFLSQLGLSILLFRKIERQMERVVCLSILSLPPNRHGVRKSVPTIPFARKQARQKMSKQSKRETTSRIDSRYAKSTCYAEQKSH